MLPDTGPIHLVLVGVGGTGSHLAPSLARLAVHARQRSIAVNLTLVDPDIVDNAIIGRQNYCFAELSYNKAETMAFRLNAAFGLAIQAVPAPFHTDMAPAGASGRALLIGAVDNEGARREMARAVESTRGRCWWLDSGNEEFSGQCLIGNLPEGAPVKLSPLRLASGLPAPHVQEPALLEPDPAETDLSCAEIVLREEQSLMTNQAAAAVAAQYAYQFVMRRQLTTFDTRFNLAPFVVTSKTITRSNLRPYLATDGQTRGA
ncbi:MAG: ThiF family adenylyltransferase [Anaerolineae bacterium]|nr:ThiF family adenylyltransferase [Anaerolineae bacterium]